MEFREGKLSGVYEVHLVPRKDERGFLARTYCEDTFRSEGLNTEWPQCNLTETVLKGAIRGMHWQEAPDAEIKLIRCEAGAVWDCLVDIRPGSPTYGQWEAIELSAENGKMVYVPEGIGHGFQTLEENSRLFYMMSTRYVPGSARGLRWDDPEVAIRWPLDPVQISERDQAFPSLSELDLK